MTYWVDNHPGGAYNIQKWSLNNGTYLMYPGLLPRRPHGMANWNNNWHKFTYIGRFGDRLRLDDLPNDLRKEEVINYFNPSANDDNSKMLVCGSPGEISNDRGSGFLFDFKSIAEYTTVGWGVDSNRKHVWVMIALTSSDQLRQRVSWALAQVSFIEFPLKSKVFERCGHTY